MRTRTTPLLSWRAAAAGLLLAPTLSACGLGGVAGITQPGTTHAPYEAIYPITVENGAELLEIGQLNGLPAGEAQRVDGFAATFRQRGEGEITVAYPSDQEAGATVEDVLHRMRLAGVSDDQIITGPYSTDADGDRGVVISYYTPVATGVGCPNYWGDTADDPSNGHMIRLGCAVRQNLAAMTARPRDLIAPQPMTPADTVARSRVLNAYRKGEDTRSAKNIEDTATRE